ncbi:MAG: TRAP-type C4-dicarboxylate transport system permease small subunit [Arcticibacterium sp.]|jgi:TRAP-type C4-dicarboxylate transport system permease small subunit
MIKKTLGRFLKYGTLISTYCLIASVLLQIFARFFLTNTPPWTEEASRLFFIYAIAFSAGLALKSEAYVYLDVFYDKLSPKIQKGVLWAVRLLTLILFGLMACYALIFTKNGLSETSASIPMPMAVSFFSMFILTASVSFYAYLDLKKPLK